MDEEDPEREKPIGVQDRYLYITRPERACKEDSSDIFRQTGSEETPGKTKGKHKASLLDLSIYNLLFRGFGDSCLRGCQSRYRYTER